MIGLDLSLTEPGWAKYYIEEDRLDFGIINVGKLKGFARISEIQLQVHNTIDEHETDTPSDTLIVLEGYSFASKGNSAISLGELGGIIRYLFWNDGYEYREVAPTQLKKFITGSGAAGKDIIIKEVYKNFGIDVNNNNAADAIGLAMIGRVAIGKTGNFKPNKEQVKLAKVIISGE